MPSQQNQIKRQNIIVIIQHLFSAVLANKHALMRYLNRYDRMKIYYIVCVHNYKKQRELIYK